MSTIPSGADVSERTVPRQSSEYRTTERGPGGSGERVGQLARAPGNLSGGATVEGASPAEASPQQMIYFIHLLRAVAPLLVLGFHLADLWFTAKGRPWGGQRLWVAVTEGHLHADLGAVGVVVFFLVSGYIITHTSLKEGHREFGIKRLLRIFPMLGVALVVAVICRSINYGLGAGDMPGIGDTGLKNVISNFVLISAVVTPADVIVTTWTLKIELLFYLGTLALLSYSRRSPLRATWMMFGGWAVGDLALSGHAGGVPGGHAIMWVGFLILGRTLYLAHSGRSTGSEALALALATGTVFVLTYTFAYPGALLVQPISAGASFAVAVVAFVALMQAPIRRLPRPVRFFGDISFSLYLLHVPVGVLVLNVMVRAGIGYTWAFLSATASSIAASYLTYRLVEVPAQRLARRIAPKRGPLHPARHLPGARHAADTALVRRGAPDRQRVDDRKPESCADPVRGTS
jgi:peptidoglycan/LPS O-acetylase OafA/YrhL